MWNWLFFMLLLVSTSSLLRKKANILGDKVFLGVKLRNIAVTSILTIFLFGQEAKAGFFTSNVQDQINEIATYRKPITELLDQLSPSLIPNSIGVYGNTQILKGGKADSDVVLNYVETYIVPCQAKMTEVAPMMKLQPELQSKVEILPLLMKGHILELRQAIAEEKADFQAKEVGEVQETLEDFLKLASSKYAVTSYNTPSKQMTDAEMFGPFGCEFWGKKRVEGSNKCEAI